MRIISIVLTVALFAVSASVVAQSRLSPGDCRGVGMAMGMMAEAANTGLAPDKILNAAVEDMSRAPADVQEMVKLMAVVTAKDAGKYEPDEIAQAMAEFCLRSFGDVGAMIKVFKAHLGIKEQSL